MVEEPNPFYKLLKAEVPTNNTSKLKETFEPVNKALNNASQLALKQDIPGTQVFILTDASFRNAGYALMMEDNPDQKIQSKRNFPACRIRPKTLFTRSTKNVDLLEMIFDNLQSNS